MPMVVKRASTVPKEPLLMGNVLLVIPDFSQIQKDPDFVVDVHLVNTPMNFEVKTARIARRTPPRPLKGRVGKAIADQI